MCNVVHNVTTTHAYEHNMDTHVIKWEHSVANTSGTIGIKYGTKSKYGFQMKNTWNICLICNKNIHVT